MAAEHGIELRFVDKEQPLEAQGPFVAILQKVRKPDWERMLVEYAAAHPEVQVFDLPAATYPLRNRGTMVSFLDGDGWVFEEPTELVDAGRPPQRCRCNVPTNTTVAAGTSCAEALAHMAAAGLRFPVLAKPLWADGREGSHALAVVHTPRGLERLVAGHAAHLQPPIMLQQYVDHGGCLFKVYVLGDISVRVKRNSLRLPQWSIHPPGAAGVNINGAHHEAQPQQPPRQPGQQQDAAGAAPHCSDTSAQRAACQQPQHAQHAHHAQHAQRQGGPEPPDLELMERVSAYPATKSWGRADTAPKGHGVPSPPAWLLQALAQRLRRQTGLTLFNFDVIVPMHLHRRLQHSSSTQPDVNGTATAEVAACSNGGRATFAAAAATAVAQLEAAAAAAGQATDACGCQAVCTAGLEEEEEPVALELSTAAAAEVAAAAAATGAAEPSARALGQGAGSSAKQQAAAAPPDVPAAERQQQVQEPHHAQQAQQQGEPPELLYHLIDINYFPGYEKMPNYEEYMVQFLRSVCSQQAQLAQQDGRQPHQSQQQQRGELQ